MTATSRDVITVQGRLTNSAGVPLNGDTPLCFRLCKTQSDPCTGGSLLFEEAQSVAVNNGLYAASLGAGSSNLDSLLTNTDAYLEIATGNNISDVCTSGTKLSPRTSLTSAAFAFRAKTADVASSVNTTTGSVVAKDGIFSGALLTAGNVGIGTTNPKSALDVAGEIKVGNSGAVCAGTTAGSVRYNAATYALELCDGYNWIVVKQGPGFTCGSTVNDGDGNTYSTVQIGAQCWMGENMRTTKYPNGSSISKGPSAHIVAGWTTDSGYYSCPPNAANNGEDCAAAGGIEKLGMVYQWSAMMNGSTTEGAQGICPTGWHIPTDAQYKTLETYLGMCAGGDADCVDATGWRGTDEGTKLKSGGSSNFNGLLAGYRDTDGSYYFRGTGTGIWSSTQSDVSAWRRYLYVFRATVYRVTSNKAYGYSARCVKD